MDERLSDIEEFTLHEIAEATSTLPDLFFSIRYYFDDPSSPIDDSRHLVYETLESLRLKGFIQLVLAQYTQVKDFTFDLVSIEPIADDHIPAVFRNPENWDESLLMDSLEHYMYRATENGYAYMRALIQRDTE